ncbi:PHP domain-containing protein [Amnibacterium setariae]|uniref:PHP domain-containing protein n=1 Tax=Amnibacterium setariae TaxID=2306585 RepID=A0A3A1U3E5_9MICO|nr:PHP domain-containing protein [Amnibacterium setariae]RIX29957.1 PHP domain-containing protein [Amnibacterium setariae]
MTPHEALAEIAFRLERDRAEPFRIQAFRHAAAAIAPASEDDLRARLRDGRLARTKGIGGRSLEVIAQALDGTVPEYLQHLRDEAVAPASPEGRALLAALRGDLHAHSEWSDGTTPIGDMVEAARLLGREYLALTDHSRGLKVANGLSEERLAEQLAVVAGIDEPGVRLLPGIEVDVLEDGTLDQDPALLDRLDVVVASLHSHLRADSSEITARLLGAIADPHTNVVGHITGRLVEGRRGTRPQSTFDSARVFAAAAGAGVAIEINSRPERQDPPDDLLAEALAAGCLFSIDTDAHAPGHLDFLGLGAERAAAAGVPPERIVTTWPVEDLLTWTHARRS